MVFNQLLWSIHSKVITKLPNGIESINFSEVTITEANVFINYFKEISSLYSQLNDFIRVSSDNVEDTVGNHCKGLYWEAFLEGVHSVLHNLDAILYKIEISYLTRSGTSMLEIRNDFVYILNVLCKLNIAVQKLGDDEFSGCKILDLCEQFIDSELPEIREIFITIQQCCLKIFYMQIKLWLIHTELHDPHEEFFIKVLRSSFTSLNSFANFSSLSLGRRSSGFAAQDFSVKYEINGHHLPLLVPFSIAVKILFIGESLMMFQNDDLNGANNTIENLIVNGINRKDIVSQISEIEKSKTFDLESFSNFVDELWIKVNSYIRKISEEVGNVKGELNLLWEIYLLGRDDLFQEFLIKGSNLLNCDVATITARNLNVTLKDAVYYVYLTENCNIIDKFYFKLPKRKALQQGLSAWTVMFLDYKVMWPLQYLFTSEVISMYNKLFYFLLRLKKAQMDVTFVAKNIILVDEHSLKMELIEVKMLLMSIVSNLRTYCLTFVITNEMNILLDSLSATNMFTDLQKSLLLFLTNISNRLFLSDQLQYQDQMQCSEILETVCKKVNDCFMKIFSLCESFSQLFKVEFQGGMLSELSKIKSNLYEILKQLFSLLHKIDQNLYQDHSDYLHIYTFLSNLIMCLDYNKFYQNKFELNPDD